MTSSPTRRAALGLLAAAALPLARSAPAAAQLLPPPPGGLPVPGGSAVPGGLRIARVAVDTSALRTAFAGDADLLAHDLQGDLRHVFADLMVGAGDRGVTLLARIHSLYLPPWAGGRRGGNGGEGPDNIEGVGIVASGSRVLSETPLYTTLDPGYSGAWYTPDITERRIASISYQFAYWLRREMGV
ncbi:hypothetical protein [Lichenibacterium dinghuense]|uniref:hypothetical protein n=1 Tax=Lichenibacterium dinghuense TaxID=2895977 RepID=UPI001F400CE1|nr:hypothetical protein [Lichenibacterium sp. 6Y81]